MKFLEPTRKPKVIYTWNLASLARNFIGIIVRQLHTDQKQMGLSKKQCAEWKKGHLQCCCNRVWTKNGGRILWNVTAICETLKIFCPTGRHHMKDGSECPLTDQWYRLEQRLNITIFLRRTHRDYINLVHNFSVMHHTEEESGKETLWSPTLKNWRRWTHQNSARRLNAKEVLTRQRNGDFIFQNEEKNK